MKSIDPNSIKLEALRTVARLKQKQLASLLHIDQSYISKIERGQIKMQECHVNRLCRLYGFQIHDFNELDAYDLVAAYIVKKSGKVELV